MRIAVEQALIKAFLEKPTNTQILTKTYGALNEKNNKATIYLSGSDLIIDINEEE